MASPPAIQKYDRFIVTCAVNNVPADVDFIKSLEAYANVNNARIVVIPIRYKNPTSIFAKEDDGEWWAEDVKKYIVNRRIKVTSKLLILCDIKTQPTASNPLNGYEAITGSSSAIIGHPKVASCTVPTPQNTLPKLLVTTGCCTLPSYTESKAGARGAFQHSIGACIVEVDHTCDAFHIRHVAANDDGSFEDLTKIYSKDGVDNNGGVAALFMGDSHIKFIDPEVVSATFTSDNAMLKVLNPSLIAWNDILDCYAISHHHNHDPIIKYAKHHSGHANIGKEMAQVFDFVNGVKSKYPNVKHLFVPSNHVDHLAKWVKETDPRNDPENAIIWAGMYTAMCKNAAIGDGGMTTIDPFVLYAKALIKNKDTSIYLKRGESFSVHNIELGMHGDCGPNGSRGSRKALDKIGTKSVVGHSHSPGICGGVYQVGTSSRYNLEYAVASPSSWLHTHCVIYKNGKRTLINIIGDKWCL
jgi:hypothetical protein